MKEDKVYRRHTRWYKFLMALLRKPALWFFKCKDSDYSDIEGPYLVLANHNMDLDPILVGCVMRRHMYFVASEHIFRLGWLSRLLEYVLAPIPRTKGSVESAAAMSIIRHLRKGHSIGIFAEGNRSYNGVTRPVHPATAKLVRSAGAKLVTLRIEGGYFTTPRWGKGIRRGGTKVALVGVYEKEEIKKMSVEEIDALIARDLYEDAFERQQTEQKRYTCKRRAEFMETALFICPECGGIGTIRSEGNDICCSCGMHAEFSDKGLLVGGPYEKIIDWDRWQRSEFEKRLAESDTQTELCRDKGTYLRRFGEGHNEISRTEGDLVLYADRIEIAGEVYPFAKIRALSIYGRNNLIFTYEGEHLEISGPIRYCALKYEYAYEWAVNTVAAAEA